MNPSFPLPNLGFKQRKTRQPYAIAFAPCKLAYSPNHAGPSEWELPSVGDKTSTFDDIGFKYDDKDYIHDEHDYIFDDMNLTPQYNGR